MTTPRRYPILFPAASAFVFLCLFLTPILLNGQAATPQKASRTLLELLDEETTLSELIFDLEDCFEGFRAAIENEERRLREEKDKIVLEFWERLQKEMEEQGDSPPGELRGTLR